MAFSKLSQYLMILYNTQTGVLEFFANIVFALGFIFLSQFIKVNFPF